MIEPQKRTQEMQISVIIPSYNSAPYLKRCIDSVLAQTRAVAEIVVVDDGSQDNTREIMAAYGDPVRYIWRENGGLSAARNTGVAAARHPWVAFLDADDWWAPRKIELQVAALEGAPDAVLCYTSKTVVAVDGTETVNTACAPEDLWPALRYRNPITPSTVVMRRDVYDSLGGFAVNLRASQDWDLWFRIGPERRMVRVVEPVTMYRLTPNSLSTSTERMLADARVLLDGTLLKDLRGWSRWAWGRRAWSAELYRSAIIARELQSPDAIWLMLRALAVWPSPVFLEERWKSLMVALSPPWFRRSVAALAGQRRRTA